MALSRRPRHVRVSMMGRGYDQDAQRVFDAFATPPTTTRKIMINKLVADLKAAGVFQLLDLFYVLAAADSQAARINWKNPGVLTASEVSSPTFTTDRGYAGNGSSSYLDTGWKPNPNGVNYTQNNASMWVWSLSDVSSNNSVIGSIDVPICNIVNRHPTLGLLSHLNVANGQYLNVAMANGSGFSGSQRTSSTAVELFKNGASVATGSKTTNGRPSFTAWICGANPAHFSTQQVAFAAWGAALTGKEAALHAAVQSYLTAVGAV